MPLSPAEIIKDVEQKQTARTSLEARWDLDYSLWRLDKFAPGAEHDLDGFRHFTSNEPRTFFNKTASLLASTILTVRAEDNEPNEEKRRVDNSKERFAQGLLRAADERLRETLQPRLKAQLSWFTMLRGSYAVRALLVKRKGDKGNETFVDVLPWDPYHVFWQMGPNGLEWVCYVIKKTPSEIKAQYNVVVEPDAANTSSEGPDDGIITYDFYDTETNKVFTDQMKMLKPSTKHGSPRVPVAIGFVGSNPPIQTDAATEATVDRGDSIYQSDRETYAELNYALSVMAEFVRRSLKQPVVITSKDGSKTLAENPYLAGTSISLAEGDKVEVLDMMTMAQETGAYLGLITGQIQRGALPYSAFGELQFQLSGFAINSLRQGMATVTEPPREAMVDAYTQIINLLTDQYLTDQFDEITLSGKDRNRQYFKEAFPVDKIKQGGDYMIDLVANLPQDDLAAMQMAIQGRTPNAAGVPLLSDRYLRETQLGLQDSDLLDDQVQEQIANQSTSLSAALNMMDAAVRAGDQQLAQVWLGEAQQQMIIKQLEIAQLQAAAAGLARPPGGGGGGGNGGGPAAAPPGVSSAIAPPAILGIPPSPPTPQIGPIVPNGTPRPGAQNP